MEIVAARVGSQVPCVAAGIQGGGTARQYGTASAIAAARAGGMFAPMVHEIARDATLGPRAAPQTHNNS